MSEVGLIEVSIRFLIRAVIFAAHWAGIVRKHALAKIVHMEGDERDKELIFLRERIRQLETQVSILQKTIKKRSKNPRYTWREKLLVLASMEYFQIPRRQVSNYFGVSRTSIYRWLRKLEISEMPTKKEPANKTPTDVASLVWEIAMTNLKWGRVRIANQLAALGVFISASTVRRLLKREKPVEPRPAKTKKEGEKTDRRVIPAFYPNHVWSADLTTVLRWGLWPTFVFREAVPPQGLGV